MAWLAGDLGIPLDSQVPSAKAATQPYWVDRENGSKQRLPESWPPAVRARMQRTMTAQICFILPILVFHKGRTTSSRIHRQNYDLCRARMKEGLELKPTGFSLRNKAGNYQVLGGTNHTL